MVDQPTKIPVIIVYVTAREAKLDMPYQSMIRLGEGKIEKTVPGTRYWVVIRTECAEVAFEATLITSINRGHKDQKQDQTPSYQFDNGVVAHGNGILFFERRTEKPLKSLHFCVIEPNTMDQGFFVHVDVGDKNPNKKFDTYEEVAAYLSNLDIDKQIIPSKESLKTKIEFEVMI